MKRKYLPFFSPIVITISLLLMSLSSFSSAIQNPLTKNTHTLQKTIFVVDAHAHKHSEKVQCHEHIQSSNCHNGTHCILITSQTVAPLFSTTSEISYYQARLVTTFLKVPLKPPQLIS